MADVADAASPARSASRSPSRSPARSPARSPTRDTAHMDDTAAPTSGAADAPASGAATSATDDDAPNLGNNLFVSGLSKRTTDATLRDVFERFGAIEKCNVVLDPHTSESRGFAFVSFERREDADAAVAALSGTENIDDRVITVEVARRARARSPTPGRYRGVKQDRRRGGGGGGGPVRDRRPRGDRFGGDRYGGDRYGGDRYGGDRYGGDRFGNRDNRDDYGRGGGGGGYRGPRDDYRRDDRRDYRRDDRPYDRRDDRRTDDRRADDRQ